MTTAILIAPGRLLFLWEIARRTNVRGALVTKVKTPPQTKRRVIGKSRPTPPRTAKSHHLDKRAERLIEPGDDDELLTTVRVADWLGVSCQWLELGRCVNYGPPFVHVSERVIRYKRSDVNDWLRSRTRNCVAEYANG